MKAALTAKQTAKELGILSDKTLRLWVQSGKLQPVKGTGGQGRAFAFHTSDVEALKRRRSGIADGDLLARVSFAFNFKNEVRRRLEDTATTDEDRKACQHLSSRCDGWLNVGFVRLWEWRKNGEDDLLAAWTRNGSMGLPLLADVPQPHQLWARRICQGLRPAEVDFLVAMFIVTEHPSVKYDTGESEAFGAALRAAEKAKPLAFTPAHVFRDFSKSKMQTAWSRIEPKMQAALQHVEDNLVKDMPDSITAQQRSDFAQQRNDLLAEEKRLFFAPGKHERAWFVFNKYCTYDSTFGLLLSANADVDSLRSLVEDGEDSKGRVRPALFAEVRLADKDGQRQAYAPSSLLSAAQKQRRCHKQRGRAKPSGAKIAAVLGVHRYQATRYWRGIVRKLGSKEIPELAGMLSLAAGQVPRLWRDLRKPQARGKRQVQPVDTQPEGAWDIAAHLNEEVGRLANAGKARSCVPREDSE